MSLDIPSYGGVAVVAVEPGTVITDPATGEEATVTDDNGVRWRGVLYVSPKAYEALRHAIPARPAEEGEGE